MSTASSREARIAVVSRKVVFYGAYVLMGCSVAAFMTGRTALGVVLVLVTAAMLFARAGWTVVRGLRTVKRAKVKVAVAPVATPDTPAPVDVVVPALLALNDDDLPYRIDATRTADGAQVDVRWKSEELRWRTLFVRGRAAYSWRMEIRLDAASARYAFTEWSGSATTSAGLGADGLGIHGSWSWKKGKTAFSRSMSFVEGADGQVTVTGELGPRTSWVGVTEIHPADAKVPVFTTLRNHGWRPRFDWFGARMFEK